MSRLILLVALAAPLAAAQPVPPEGADLRLLHAIYAWDDPAVTGVLRAAEWSSTRVFLAAIPTAWAATWAVSEAPRDFGPAYRLTLAQVGTYGITAAVKRTVRRPRPYRVEEGIVSRSPAHPAVSHSYSFPSGHASIAFALATSASLSYPEWYVVAPAVGWATAVALARPWVGVHYPSDIAVGALLGTGVAVAVHALGDSVTPSALRGEGAGALALPLLVIQF
jgi:membrane-associated phospholipid phosphatase